MGTLTPGAIYIYETDGQKIYARQAGVSYRSVIGETMNSVYQQRAEDHLWRQIRQEAQHNAALKDSLDRAIMIYNLSQPHG